VEQNTLGKAAFTFTQMSVEISAPYTITAVTIAQLVKAWICYLRIAGSSLTAGEAFFLGWAFSKPLTPNC